MDNPILLEHRGELGKALRGGVGSRMLVDAEDLITLLGLECDGGDLGVVIPSGLG